MSGAQHTPGPWVGMVNGKFDSDHDWCAEDTKALSSESAPIWANGKVIALVVHSQEAFSLDAHPSITANAALIAAAPELLAALRVLLRDVEAVDAVADYGLELQVGIYQAHKAIDKATGGAA